MLSYIFFHEKPLALFQQFLQARKIEPVVSEQSESFEVSIPENMDDELHDEIEQEYDRLFEMNQALMDSNPISEKEYAMASITLRLQDGRESQAMVRPQLINKALSVFSNDEFSELVQSIVTSVENPDARNFCQRVRDAAV
jgi:TorA maturation chaperone TorD